MKSKVKYKIKTEPYKYYYRDYMACQENAEPNCVGRGVRYIVLKGKRKLQSFYGYGQALSYIKRLHKRVKQVRIKELK